jgi:hypothetical protein
MNMNVPAMLNGVTGTFFVTVVKKRLAHENSGLKKPFFRASDCGRLRQAGCWALFNETVGLKYGV